MTAITIPKELAKEGELVIIPRKEYEEFLRLRKAFPLVKLTAQQKNDLAAARRELRRGEYSTLEKMEYELGIARKKAH